MPKRVIRRVDDEAFIKLFDDSTFDLTRALLAFRCSKEVDWKESSCLGGFPYFSDEGAVKKLETFTVLGR